MEFRFKLAKKDDDYIGDIVVKSAKWLYGFVIEITYSDGYKNIVSFERFIQSRANHECIRPFLKISNFKKFKIDSGHLVWGKDWDMVFPTAQLYRGFIKL